MAIDSTLSKEGLYVAVSRAKQKLSLYTADNQKLFKQAERSSAKENPSDYLTLFSLVNPDAENEKAADSARALRSADQSEYLGDLAGKRVAVGHRAAIRRDLEAEGRSPRPQSAAVALYRSTSQVTRGVSQLSNSSASAARESERAAADASRELAAVARRQQQRVEQDRKRRLRREIYQQYAERVGDGVSVQHQDQKVAEQILVEMVRENRGKPLTPQDKRLAAAIIEESPESLRIEQTEGKDSAHQYAISILKAAKQQLIARAKSVDQAKQKERGGVEL